VLPSLGGALPRTIETNGIHLAVYEAGPQDGPAVVLCHGFPELAYSWRHQVPALVAAGYQVLVPDQRGYGDSDRPEGVLEYDIFHLTGDLVGLLDALSLERAVFAGHDWGGLVVWQLALLHPSRVAGVVGVNTPFFARLPVAPTEVFRLTGGENHYILYFQEPGVADAAMAANVRGVFSGLMRRGVPPREVEALVSAGARNWAETVAESALPGEELLSAEELDVFAGTFARTGFTGGLNWYRNFDRNWELTPELEGAKIDVPCLMVTAEWDPVLAPALAQGMDRWIADLETHMIARCGHWTQQERPDELNRLLVDWLGRRFPPAD
jgi:pimeloyl-ACP methyl ester carboxylesterase